MDDFVVAGTAFPSRRFLVNQSGGELAQSVLGSDFLSLFDIEIDARNGRIGLFKTQGCADADMAFWAPGKGDVVDIISPGTPEITVRINGQPITATFDTGAGSTILTQKMATFLGVEKEAGAQKRIGVGLDGRRLEGYRQAFQSFEIGEEQIKAPVMTVLDGLKPLPGRGTMLSYKNSSDMLLGFDFLRAHHVFILAKDKKLFFTYEGGPVFSAGQPSSR